MGSKMSTLILLSLMVCCVMEGTCADACNCTDLRLVNDNNSVPNISESDCDMDNSSSTWPISSGRVEVCWGGEWRGLLHGSIRTTHQLELICKGAGFSPDGAEICEGASDDNCSDLVHCWFNTEDNLTIYNCSNVTSLWQQTCNKTSNFINLDMAAVIKCRTLRQFSPQDIALMVLCPFSLLLISALIVVTLRLFQVNLRMKTRAQNQPKVVKKPNRVQVTTRKCVAYEACTFNGQDDGIHQETIDHLSNTEASVAAKSKPCDAEKKLDYMYMEPNYEEVHDIFEIAEVTLKARARSLENLPLEQQKKTTRVGKGFGTSSISWKPPLRPKPGSLVRSLSNEWDGEFHAGRKKGAHVLKSRMGVSLPRNIRKAPLPPQQCATVPFAERSTVLSSPGRHFEPPSSGQDNTGATVAGVVMERSEECGGYVRVDM